MLVAYIDLYVDLWYPRFMARGDSYQLQGQQGGKVFNAGNVVTGSFRWLQIVNDTVFSAFTSNIEDGGTKLITITHNAGTGIGGNITGFTVTSGVVIGYYA